MSSSSFTFRFHDHTWVGPSFHFLRTMAAPSITDADGGLGMRQFVGACLGIEEKEIDSMDAGAYTSMALTFQAYTSDPLFFAKVAERSGDAKAADAVANAIDRQYPVIRLRLSSPITPTVSDVPTDQLEFWQPTIGKYKKAVEAADKRAYLAQRANVLSITGNGVSLADFDDLTGPDAQLLMFFVAPFLSNQQPEAKGELDWLIGGAPE